MSKELEVKAPIQVFLNKGNANYAPSWRLFITVKDLESIPADLFATKVSQSQNPDLAGKVVFKYFSFKVNDATPFSIHTPQGTDVTTPPAELKQLVIDKLGSMDGVEMSLVINLPGNFCNIETPQGTFTVFDKKEFPKTDGKPGYFLKSESEATVKLTEATHLGNKYYQVRLSTELSPDELFLKAGRAQVWGQDDASVGASDDGAVDDGAADDGSPW